MSFDGGGLDELASELARFVEQLGDAAMDLLREGIADGSEQAAEAATARVKLINRARSAVEKAVVLVRRAADARADVD